MKQVSVTTLFVLLCVGLTHTAAEDDQFKLVLHHIDLLRLQVQLLQSHCQSSKSVPRDCADIKAEGKTSSGVYTVYIGDKLQPTPVYCDMTTDGGRWLVFQRRRDGSVDFYRTWSEYSAGFGSPSGEYWLGNEALSWLTSSNNKRYELRVDLSDFNGTGRYAIYSEFKIASAGRQYQMVSLGQYSGNAGDSLTSSHKGKRFSTKDRDHDTYGGGSCANSYKGGWWYGGCHSSNLNGLYLRGSHTSYADGVEWKSWTGYHYSLKTSEMKIRPVRGQV